MRVVNAILFIQDVTDFVVLVGFNYHLGGRMRYLEGDFDLPHKVYKATEKLIIHSIYSLVNLSHIRRSLTQEIEFYSSIEGMDGEIEHVITWLGTLQSRASASISHISIMLGVTVMLAVNTQPSCVFILFILLEMGLYSYLLLCCLIVVRSMTLNDRVVCTFFKGKFQIEMVRRFAAMQIINSLLVVATIVFFFIIVFSLVSLI